MTLSIRVRPYDVVCRIAADGSVYSHVGRIQEVVDETGAVQPGMAMELPVEPLDLAGPEFGPLVEALNIAVMGDNRRLTADAAALSSTLATTQAERNTALAQVADCQARIAALEAELATLRPAAE